MAFFGLRRSTRAGDTVSLSGLTEHDAASAPRKQVGVFTYRPDPDAPRCRPDDLDTYRTLNIGDAVIEAGILALLGQVWPLQPVIFDRLRRWPRKEDVSLDLLAYAGMPQFGARNEPSAVDAAWARLRETYPPPLPAINVGCGTGYSLLDNRLRVAADMARRPFNQAYYQAQNDVLFVPRDPLSWHFLDMLGLDPLPGLCPSGFCPTPDRAPTHDLAIAIANPASKLNEEERAALGYDMVALFRQILHDHPGALVIGQEDDGAVIRQLGVDNWVMPETLDEFLAHCGQARAMISFRVHGSIAALLQGRPVLHYAIDGRSDLLTPYMAAGLRKQNCFRDGLEGHARVARQFSQTPPRDDIGPAIAAITDPERRRIGDAIRLAGESQRQATAGRSGTIVVDPGDIAALRPGDDVLLTAARFQSSVATRPDERLAVPVRGIGRHVIYGPYIRLPAGSYRAIFDLEFWGHVAGEAVTIGCDAADAGAEPLATHSCALHDMLATIYLPSLDFTLAMPGENVELRVDIQGEAAGLTMEFHGVRLRYLGPVAPPEVSTARR